MACSQPCYRVKIILVKEEYTHSLYSMDENPWLDEPSWVSSSSLLFFSSSGHLSCDKGRYCCYLQDLPFRERRSASLSVSHSGCAQKTWGTPPFFPALLQCARSGRKEVKEVRKEDKQRDQCLCILRCSLCSPCRKTVLKLYSPTTPGPLPL